MVYIIMCFIGICLNQRCFFSVYHIVLYLFSIILNFFSFVSIYSFIYSFSVQCELSIIVVSAQI